MNFFRGRKKQEDQPATPSSASASAPAASLAQRPLQRGPSINGITIPPRTKSTSASSVPGASNQSSNPAQGPPVQTPGSGQSQGASPRNNNPEQQQQYYQPQQQQQQQVQYQQDSDSASLHSVSLLPQQQQQQQSMQMQAMPQQGSYAGESNLISQALQYPYQDQPPHSGNLPEGSYDGGFAGGAQDENLSSSSGQSDYYLQTNPGFENNSNTLSSGPLQLPSQGATNGGRSGTPTGMDSANSGSLGNGSSPGEVSTDVRKLQDEITSWRKSQESSQAKLSQLRQTLTQKSQENRELHAGLTQVTQDRLMLQELVHKREKEMDDLRSKYLNDVRQIRATDDDHGTIEQRVRMLQAAILQLTKSSSGDRAVNLKTEEVQSLVKKKYKFGNTQPYILNMFLEKYIMDTLLEEVFHGPFYVGFSLANEYGNIHKWMIDNNFADQAVRFRQQLCFMSAKAPVAQAHAAQEAIRIAKAVEVKLERLYNNWTGHQKVLDLVTKAIELSLTMRSQNAEIMAQVIPGESEFDAEKMVPAHKSKEGGKVKVCVIPCFVDTNGVVVGKAKVFCG